MMPVLVSAVAVATALATLLPQPQGRPPRVPFGVGERFTYDVKFGPFRAGNGSMEVVGLDTIRGRVAWHTVFHVKGGVLGFRANNFMESWIDTVTLSSLRFTQDFDQTGKDRNKHYEFFPERATFQDGSNPEQPSVPDPLDDASFIYFVRTVPLEVGQTYDFNRYFRPDRNPVRIRVLRKEKVTVPAGTYETIVVQPIIKARGIFSEKSKAEIWFSDDVNRIMVQLKADLPLGSLNLYLKSARPPTLTIPSLSSP